MALRPPRLDDRDFTELVDEARRQLRRSCPEWSDLTPGDPGMALLEVFAHLTETMIYRLNRLPEKAFVEFLRLIGVRRQPPFAATATLRFTPAATLTREVELPRGTRVTTSRGGGGGEPPVFVTGKTVRLQPGAAFQDVPACHVEYVPAELVGKGTGLPGQSVAVQRPPIVAPIGNDLDLVVGVETAAADVAGDRAGAVLHDGKTFRLWREVENFTDLGEDLLVYRVDRMGGFITFAPAVRMPGPDGRLTDVATGLAQVPPQNAEIRVWYSRGGGAGGNVAAGVLDTLKDPAGAVRLAVTNPAPASGGRAEETLENAILRGPLELHSLKRAVTARDYELVALHHSAAIERAKAFTRAELWRHAAPGTVEVLLVPKIPDESRASGITAAMLLERQTQEIRLLIQRTLDERRTLGTTCLVNWVRYKTVRVGVRVVVHREENPRAVEQRVLDRLNQTISPLTSERHPQGWRFGQTLRDSHIYDMVLAEPGVSYAENVEFVVDEVPDKGVTSLASDCSQAHTWYAATGGTVFRTLNDGEGWEPAGRFPGEEARNVVTHPWKPGMIACTTQVPGDKLRTRIYTSADCGESWSLVRETTFRVEGMAWALREGNPLLFLATDVGLYEILLRPGEEGSPVQVVVDAKNPGRGYYAVSTSIDINNQLMVAAAAQGTGGIFLSNTGGRSESFRAIGLVGEDIRDLAVSYDGPKSFLWAAVAASGPTDEGKGCFSWELLGSKDPVEKWRPFAKGWGGGSCLGLAFQGTRVLAATHHKGVLSLDTAGRDAAWVVPDFVKSGLPLRDEGRLQPVDALATDPQGLLVLGAGAAGVYRSVDRGVTYAKCSDRNVASVTLPETWLFSSGKHVVSVEVEDE